MWNMIRRVESSVFDVPSIAMEFFLLPAWLILGEDVNRLKFKVSAIYLQVYYSKKCENKSLYI